MATNNEIQEINTAIAKGNPSEIDTLKKKISAPFTMRVQTTSANYTPEFVTWNKSKDEAGYDRKPTKIGDAFNIVRVVGKSPYKGGALETWYISDNGKAISEFYFTQFIYSVSPQVGESGISNGKRLLGDVATIDDDGSGKYITNKDTAVLRTNKNKTDLLGDMGTDIVRTIPKGTVIDIAKKGGGGRGDVMTPYLIFDNGDYIIGYDATKMASTKTDKIASTGANTPTEESFFAKNKTAIIVCSAVAVAGVAYYFYTKKKK